MHTVLARSLDELGSVPDGGVVAKAVGLSKVYGTGDAAVAALDDVTVEFGRGRLTEIMETTLALNGRTILVDQSTAMARGWQIGDTLTGDAGALTAQHLVVGGIYRDSQTFGSHVMVDRSLGPGGCLSVRSNSRRLPALSPSRPWWAKALRARRLVIEKGAFPAGSLSVLRLATGFVFLWAYFDKTFGPGTPTGSSCSQCWVSGSP